MWHCVTASASGRRSQLSIFLNGAAFQHCSLLPHSTTLILNMSWWTFFQQFFFILSETHPSYIYQLFCIRDTDLSIGLVRENVQLSSAYLAIAKGVWQLLRGEGHHLSYKIEHTLNPKFCPKKMLCERKVRFALKWENGSKAHNHYWQEAIDTAIARLCLKITSLYYPLMSYTMFNF